MRLALILLTLLLALAVPAGSHTADRTADRCSSASAGAIPDSGDEDCDGVRTDGQGARDNCPTIRNADQANGDAGHTATSPAAEDGSTKSMPAGDAAGDACDDDDDADGIPDGQPDNCRLRRNPDQLDANGDGRGEKADGTALCPPADTDADGVADEDDNCPPNSSNPKTAYNPDQADNDQDRRGDLCDLDDDGDSRLDRDDNCPRASNSEQTDKDGDGIGTACDPQEIPAAPAEAAFTADTTKPVVRLTSSSRRSTADALGGLATGVSCSEACGLKATLKVGGRTVASAHGLLGARGRTWLIFSFRRGAAARLRGRRATLEVRALDSAGNSASSRRNLRFT
jgi:hypothetical protein